MSDSEADPFRSIRNPEYTGENRCVPCTVLNVCIALLLAAGASRRNRVLGGVTLAGALGLIYLRGYLVPGTPTLTRRYLPEEVLALFGKGAPETRDGWETEPEAADESAETDSVDAHDGSEADADEEHDPEFETVERIEAQRESEVDPVEFLLDVGAVESVEGAEELAFTEAFAARVSDRVEELSRESIDAETLAGMFDVEPDEIAFKDRSYPAVTVRRRVRKWPGDVAYLADVGSHLALAEVSDDWADVAVEQRLAILKSLRSFHTSCPVCGGPIELSENTVESCCRAYEVLAFRCDDCAEHLLELDPEEVATSGPDTGITP